MKRFLKNQKGVTMMEVLVTVALLAIVVVPCLSAFIMAQRGNVLANQTYNEYTQASNLIETLKGVPVGDDWADEIEEVISNENEKTDGKISVFATYVSVSEGTYSYYEIRIYAGELEEEPDADSGEEPILKGVIAP